nr:uncharacterized protein CTRU02_12142 [Colletotrichum truncatum]KAF6784931.1 hypothetical protein CTRU02_12142 [Colletotrichum truncatum]
MRSTLVAVGLAQAAVVLAVYKGYACIMPNGQKNPSNNLCDDAFGTPLPGGICCINNDQSVENFRKGCIDNKGVRAEDTPGC